MILLGDQNDVTYSLKRALIESDRGGSHQFLSKGYLRKHRMVDPNSGEAKEVPLDKRTFEGWKYEKL